MSLLVQTSIVNRGKLVLFSILGGVFIGFINGFLGAGGGMLLVPFLTCVLKIEPRRAHATAIFIILPICLTSSVFYLVRGIFDFSCFLPSAIGTIIGGIIGSVLLCKLKNKVISGIFSFLLIGAGLYMGIGGLVS